MARGLADHEFGNDETDLKLSLVAAYLSAFTKALRRKYPNLWYIDVFAGTGLRTIIHEAVPASLFDEPVEERVEQRRGSALLAIETTPPFTQLVLVDLRRKHFRALEALRDANPGRKIVVLRNDANAVLRAVADRLAWSSTRAVAFLDPYGMQVDWATLEAIRRTEAVDVWYLVSLAGLYRQAPHDHAKITEIGRARITRMLGTPDWEGEWYTGDVPDIFDIPQRRTRIASVDSIEAYVRRRLRGLFPAVLDPLRLRNKNGGPAFALFFCMSNPDPKAVTLATKIASQILASGRASHNEPR